MRCGAMPTNYGDWLQTYWRELVFVLAYLLYVGIPLYELLRFIL